MIKARTIIGSREQVASEIIRLRNEVVEAIVFTEEADTPVEPSKNLFSEMDPHTVSVADVDYSRESIYASPENG